MQATINTARLSLDILTTDDHEFIKTLVNTRGWIEFIGNRNINSKEDAIAYINRINSTPKLTYWVTRIRAANTPIGVISFLKRDYLENFDIGFAFLPEFTGYGYAYEAAKAILDMVSGNPEYTPVLATTMPANTSSIRLLTKLGLRFEKVIEVNNEKLSIYTNAPVGLNNG